MRPQAPQKTIGVASHKRQRHSKDSELDSLDPVMLEMPHERSTNSVRKGLGVAGQGLHFVFSTGLNDGITHTSVTDLGLVQGDRNMAIQREEVA